jgi:hypothetical protein
MIVVKQNGLQMGVGQAPDRAEMPNAAVLFALLAETGAGRVAHPQDA